MIPCKEIQDYIDLVRANDPNYPFCKDQLALVDYVEKCFQNESITVNTEQLTNYLGLTKYFPYEDIFPWQKFAIAMHLCCYRADGLPRWKTIFFLIGRGAGKDGTIALESMCVTSPYHPIKKYDVDICANNEEQAKRPVQDLIEVFEEPQNFKKLSKFYRWTKEQIRSKYTGATIKGRTNSPRGKDGLRSGLVVFNEVHQYVDTKNINVFTTGLGKVAHPRISFYTTNGDISEGVLDDYIKKSERILYEGKPDDGFLPVLYRLNSKDLVHDERNWHMANPSLRFFPSLMEEMRSEYGEYVENPARLPDFMTKRMNLRESNTELQVTEWDNIVATNREIPDLKGFECTVGIDYAKTTDWVAVNFHFRKDEERYDINHAWMCINNKQVNQLKCPWQEWGSKGYLTVVDEVEIRPSLITNYIKSLSYQYKIKTIYIDDYRFALMESALRSVGFSTKNKTVKLVRKSDIIRLYPVIDSCFANHFFVWGDNPVLRWATNNTKLLKVTKSALTEESFTGNYYFGKIDAQTRKTDPFMALVMSMVGEHLLPIQGKSVIPKTVARKVVKY